VAEIDLQELAIFGGGMLGYGILMVYAAIPCGELEDDALLRRLGPYLPAAGFFSLVGLTAAAIGTMSLAAAIWP
jgi:hypothetical protein